MPLLWPYQSDAVSRMKNGCVLCGGVGSGKSRTALAYYFAQQGGILEPYTPMPGTPKDLYIITTARKRDTLEWEGEMATFMLLPNDDNDIQYYSNKKVIDSWNNIKKYRDVKNAFFIFDEQRVVGYGEWTKAFLTIAKNNSWILLSATPGDTWSDYIPVFIANGFYRNKTEFTRQHIVYSRYAKYPKVDHYENTGKLLRLRNSILVDMDFHRDTIPHHENIFVNYDKETYKFILRKRFNLEEDRPLVDAADMCRTLRKLVNTDESRQAMVLELCEKHPKVIIFYNYNYELDILKGLAYPKGTLVREWNGHKHEQLPTGDRWVYLVQYTAGAEGWNCTTTDTIIFYSQNYSYKIMVQSAGRIDRANTPFEDLYFYHLKTNAGIDLAISKALSMKKKFNENKFITW